MLKILRVFNTYVSVTYAQNNRALSCDINKFVISIFVHRFIH